MNTSAKWLSLYQYFLKNITNVQAEQFLFSVANNCDKGLHGIFSHYWFIFWLGDRSKRVNSTFISHWIPASDMRIYSSEGGRYLFVYP